MRTNRGSLTCGAVSCMGVHGNWEAVHVTAAHFLCYSNKLPPIPNVSITCIFQKLVLAKK